MNPIKQIGTTDLGKSIKDVTETHRLVHKGVAHHSLNSAERRAANQEALKARNALGTTLGKGK